MGISPPVKRALKLLNLERYISIIPSTSFAMPNTTPDCILLTVSYPINGTFQSPFTNGNLAVNSCIALNRISMPGEMEPPIS